jgi:hypothetical protein
MTGGQDRYLVAFLVTHGSFEIESYRIILAGSYSSRPSLTSRMLTLYPLYDSPSKREFLLGMAICGEERIFMLRVCAVRSLPLKPNWEGARAEHPIPRVSDEERGFGRAFSWTPFP